MAMDDEAQRLDEADPLAHWRDEFVIRDPDLVYLDGNSLGMTPKRTVTALRTAVEEQWAGDLISNWFDNDWINLSVTVGDELAPLIGARPGEVTVHDSTTICLFQLVNVALDLTPPSANGPKIIAVADTEFPTDRYVVDGIARLRSVDGGRGPRDDQPAVITRRGFDDLDGVSVVVRSLVDYRTAEVADIVGETARARAAGAVTVWDLSHTAGLLPVDLEAAGVELAAGCTYKFLNGGPGSPGFTYVRSNIQDRVVQPIWGWFAQRDQFAMDAPFDPREGAARLLNGTPHVLSLLGARCGISLSAEAGIEAIATKAASLSDFGRAVANELGLHCDTLPVPESSGGHIVIRHRDAARLQGELADRKIVVDKRDPDVLRIGLSPLTTRHSDVYRALATLDELI